MKYIEDISKNSNTLLYMQIMHKLSEEFKLKKIKPGAPFPSVRELSRRFKTSKATIEKAINELKSRKVVSSYPRKGAFWGKKENLVNYKTIGVCVPVAGGINPTNSPYYYAIIEEIRCILLAEGFCLKLLRPSVIIDVDELKNICCDAIICAGTHPSILHSIDKFKNWNIPYLLIDRPANEDSLNYLERDSKQNLYDITTSLISKGHKSIGLINFKSNLWIYEKIKLGFSQAMSENKLDIKNSIFELEKHKKQYYVKPDEKCLLDFCRRHTAFVIGLSRKEFLLFFFDFFLKHNIKIPDASSVISLSKEDNLDIKNFKINYFPITPEMTGRKVAKGILDIVKNNLTDPLHIEFPTKLKRNYDV